MRLLTLLCAAVLLLAVTTVTVSGQQCNVPQRQDCGYVGIDEQQCKAKGCCWQPDQSGRNDPWCFNPARPSPQYVVSSFTQQSIGFTAQLRLANPGSGQFGPAIPALQLTAVYESDSRVHFRLTDAKEARYEIPQRVLPYPTPGTPDFPAAGQPGSFNPSSPSFLVSTSTVGQNLSLAVKRASDGTVLFDLGAIEYSNQYLQLTTLLPEAGNPLLYGLGEHVMNFKLPTDDHMFTMWNVDIPAPWDQNEYGAHPFLMQTLAKSGLAHGMFVRSSNGMDVVTSKSQVQFRMIGGILEWYVFIGPTHEKVVQQYQQVVGRPHLPPYWSLGWHQCKYGWKNLAEVKTVVQKYAEAKIPLDTMWADIDFMDKYLDFTWDPVNYPLDQVQKFTADLHAKHMRYVPIVDPGIHDAPGYDAYDKGLAQGIFITHADGRTPYIGEVWPGSTAFPDFLHPNTSAYWEDQLRNFLTTVPYDGIWIDMNEISSFQDGGTSGSQDNPVNNPPYKINNFNRRASLDTKTLPVDARLGQGSFQEYDVHNLYGLAESIATKEAVEKIQGVRSFVLSRSTFSGSGKHVAHWLGDNFATWDDLWRSIPGMLNMNLYGIPMVGADICGFIGQTTEELCARWTALGAFYTFSRNHAEPGPNQEPYLWQSVAAVARRTLSMRYSLLPMLYTQLEHAHTSGGTVVRSLMFNFPRDSETYPIDSQFMWGRELLVTPVLSQGANSVKGYFPPEQLWYDAWTLRQQDGGWRELPCSISDGILLHIAGGSVVPTQTPELTTGATRLNPFTLIVAADASGQASGSLFWDSGDDLVDGANSIHVGMAANTGRGGGVSWKVQRNTYKAPMPPVSTVKVAGFGFYPSKVTVNGRALWSSQFVFDEQRRVLVISDVDAVFDKDTTISWS